VQGCEVLGAWRQPPNLVSHNAKIRSAISKHCASSDANKHAKLITEIKRKREECWHAQPPRQISGLQLLYVSRRFFEVRRGDRTMFGISALISLECWGDSRLPGRKTMWDYMVASLRRPLDEQDLEHVHINKIRKPEVSLRDQVTQCDRQDEDRPDHTYR